MNYIPAGCTGVWQPADVGIQRPLKHAMRQCAHQHLIRETMDQLDSGTQASKIKFDTRIGVVRNRSVEWVVKGYKAINNVDLVKKVSSFSHQQTVHEYAMIG